MYSVYYVVYQRSFYPNCYWYFFCCVTLIDYSLLYVPPSLDYALVTAYSSSLPYLLNKWVQVILYRRLSSKRHIIVYIIKKICKPKLQIPENFTTCNDAIQLLICPIIFFTDYHLTFFIILPVEFLNDLLQLIVYKTYVLGIFIYGLNPWILIVSNHPLNSKILNCNCNS